MDGVGYKSPLEDESFFLLGVSVTFQGRMLLSTSGVILGD